MSGSVMVIGATGLVGREIVRQSLENSAVDSVSAFVRKPSDLSQLGNASNLKEHVVNFDRVSTWSHLLTGDTLFSAMGTTLRQAGSEEAQYKVDYQYQWDVAHAARQNGCQTLVLISSAGADANSPFFYLRTKGELEADVEILGFPCLRILRPGLLNGNRSELRSESRIGELIANKVLEAADRLLPRALFPIRLKPIPVATVAAAAIRAANRTHAGTLIFGPAELWPLAK